MEAPKMLNPERPVDEYLEAPTQSRAEMEARYAVAKGQALVNMLSQRTRGP